jgi:hypothetical protein
MIVATFLTKLVVHLSMAGGMMGMMVPLYAIPGTLGPFVAWAVATRRLPTDFAARRWLQPSCSRAVCGRSRAPMA